MNFVECRKFSLIFERVISRVISAVAISLVGNEQRSVSFCLNRRRGEIVDTTKEESNWNVETHAIVEEKW